MGFDFFNSFFAALGMQKKPSCSQICTALETKANQLKGVPLGPNEYIYTTKLLALLANYSQLKEDCKGFLLFFFFFFLLLFFWCGKAKKLLYLVKFIIVWCRENYLCPRCAASTTRHIKASNKRLAIYLQQH
jgi:hypothetical protein